MLALNDLPWPEIGAPIFVYELEDDLSFYHLVDMKDNGFNWILATNELASSVRRTKITLHKGDKVNLKVGPRLGFFGMIRLVQVANPADEHRLGTNWVW